MQLKSLLALLLAFGLSTAAIAQDAEAPDEDFPAAEDTEAPIPPPRPVEFGGSEPLALGDDSDGIDPSIVIDGGEFDMDIVARPDYSHVTDPQPVTLSARITDDGPIIPNGLVWRIFEARVDESGELALAAKSEDATANVSLPPGEYVLHVAFGRAQASDTIFVEPGPNNLTLTFEVGALQLSALISGDVPIPTNMLNFDIYSNGPGGRFTVAENVSPGELVHLNAGVYSIESRFGDLNAVVRSELRVEPGQITEATLFHRASQIALKLVSEEGGEAIADVEWTIQTTGGETLFTDIGAFPATVLAEGDYIAIAKLGENVYNREFEVRPGGQREIEILTAVY